MWVQNHVGHMNTLSLHIYPRVYVSSTTQSADGERLNITLNFSTKLRFDIWIVSKWGQAQGKTIAWVDVRECTKFWNGSDSDMLNNSIYDKICRLATGAKRYQSDECNVSPCIIVCLYRFRFQSRTNAGDSGVSISCYSDWIYYRASPLQYSWCTVLSMNLRPRRLTVPA